MQGVLTCGPLWSIHNLPEPSRCFLILDVHLPLLRVLPEDCANVSNRSETKNGC